MQSGQGLSLSPWRAWRLGGSFALEVRFAFFDKRGHAFGEVARRRAPRERLDLRLELSFERALEALADEPLRLRERAARPARETLRDLRGLGLQRRTVRDPVHQA